MNNDILIQRKHWWIQHIILKCHIRIRKFISFFFFFFLIPLNHLDYKFSRICHLIICSFNFYTSALRLISFSLLLSESIEATDFPRRYQMKKHIWSLGVIFFFNSPLARWAKKENKLEAQVSLYRSPDINKPS